MEPWSDFRLAIASIPSPSSSLLPTLRRYLPTNPYKLLTILFLLLNLKSLPFAWHIRLLRGLILQTLSSRRRVLSLPGPLPLFAPIITSTRCSVLECDYNLHKSNSTYFSDFDVGRLHLLVALLGHGVQVTRKELMQEMPERGKEGFFVALGGVAVNFAREIKPFEKVEVWTRVLGWDGKWLYVVGHFIRPGSVRVGGEVLGGGGKGEGRRVEGKGGEKRPVVYASAVAKYVCKKGRLTIPPERVLRASKLLPHKPEEKEGEEVGMKEEGRGDNGVAVDGVAGLPVAEAVLDRLTPDKAEGVIADAVLAKDDGVDGWDWARVERERLRGMKIAQVYSDLDGLSAEAPEHGSIVLGRY